MTEHHPQKGVAEAGRAADGGPKILVIIPTYDEAENIEHLITAILSEAVDAEVLVVDDDSPDGTADIVAQIGDRDARVHLLRRAGKMGLGSAYREGFRYGLERTQADLFFQMDADFSHDPRAMRDFIDAAETADLVLGSRYLHGVTVVNWPLKRLFLSYGANVYARFITGMPFKDATGGYKCFRREVLAALDWTRIRSDGYAFQIETTYMVWRKRFRIAEIPIIFMDRRVGISKMNRRIVVEAIFLVWRLALRHILQRRPKQRAARPRCQRSREAP